MVEADAGTNNTLRQLEQIQLAGIHHKSHGCFGLTGIGNILNTFPIPLKVSVVMNFTTYSQEVKEFSMTRYTHK